jgi:hypothetical protein
MRLALERMEARLRAWGVSPGRVVVQLQDDGTRTLHVDGEPLVDLPRDASVHQVVEVGCASLRRAFCGSVTEGWRR